MVCSVINFTRTQIKNSINVLKVTFDCDNVKLTNKKVTL